MLHRQPLIALALAVAVCLTSQCTTTQPAKESTAQAEKAIRDVYERLLKASKERDEKALREVLADDYSQVTADGRIRSKEQRIKETLQPNDQVNSITLDDFQPRVYADTAIALCRVRDKGMTDGQAYDSPILSTAVFVRQGGVWRIAATHLAIENSFHCEWARLVCASAASKAGKPQQ